MTFETVSDIQRELNSIKEIDFHGAFEVWKRGWDNCIYSQGNYFKKVGTQNSVSQLFFLPNLGTFQ
jgi:hypothetical protein